MPTKSKIDLSVIIPAYNEAARLGSRLESVLKYLHAHYPNFQLIIVNDGSSDDTASIVSTAINHEPRARLITYQPNRGKGYAVRTGVSASSGEIVLFMDADLSTPLGQIPQILKILKNFDIVIGSRGLANSDILNRPPLHRRLASYIFDQIKFLIVGLRNFRDTQCGFKAFRGQIARQLFAKAKIDRYMFDVEILYLAQQAKLRIAEIPVVWADMPGSHVHFWEGLISMFRDLWRIRTLHAGKKLKNSKTQSSKQKSN